MRIASATVKAHLLVLAVAGIWSASNLTKPVTVDDTAYYEYARHIATHPTDPYGFTIFWYQSPQPAIEVLAPPVWPYWWAAGLRWFGEREWAWKLWQFPFVYLFVASFAALARRFAGGSAASVLPAFVVVSPVFLPSLNLMLDVPALALALSGLVVFARASDLESAGQAVLAGLIVGLAMQTKYTATLVPAVMMLYAACLGRVRLAFVAAGTAAVVFASWELVMLGRYGQSQFIAGMLEPSGRSGVAWSLVPALLTLAGGVGSAWGFLGMTALGVRGRVVVPVMLASVAAFLAVGWLPNRMPVSLPATLAAVLGRTGFHLNPPLDVCRLLGGLAAATMTAVAVRIGRKSDRTDAFLIAWLALEIVGYLLLNPFVAVRRVMGLAVVATLIIGRLASRTCASAERKRLILAVAGYGAVMALLFAATDRADAVAQRDGATLAADVARVDGLEPGARVWYVGHWGFQYYAERAGMQAVAPGASYLRKGDALVAPGPPVDAQRVKLDSPHVVSTTQVAVDDALPWQTVPGYYRGAVPLASRPSGPRLTVRVYRVLGNFVPEARSVQ